MPPHTIPSEIIRRRKRTWLFFFFDFIFKSSELDELTKSYQKSCNHVKWERGGKGEGTGSKVDEYRRSKHATDCTWITVRVLLEDTYKCFFFFLLKDFSWSFLPFTSIFSFVDPCLCRLRPTSWCTTSSKSWQKAWGKSCTETQAGSRQHAVGNNLCRPARWIAQ